MYTLTVSQILKDGREVARYYADGIYKDGNRIYKFTADTVGSGFEIDNHHNEKNIVTICRGLGL